MKKNSTIPDVCLFLEGTFPYIAGGVSSWLYDLILNHPELTFTILTIIPPSQKLEYKYEIPPNIINIENLTLYDLPKGKKIKSKNKTDSISKELTKHLNNILKNNDISALKEILDYINSNRRTIGRKNLFSSRVSWNVIKDMYKKFMPNGSFLDFFWSWRALFGGLFTVLLAEIPEAKCYHSLCTGYAGLLLAKAKLETGKSCFLTEHGIYTNERRIEIATAQWLFDQKQYSLSINDDNNSGLQNIWTQTFSNYSKYCYHCCDYIITLFEGNRKLQIIDGAPIGKTKIIPNGIDYERFAKIQKIKHNTPTIALIGRVVPIKDVKTFIRAVSNVRKKIPEIKAYIMGPEDEDEKYYEECLKLVDYENLRDNIEFTGKVMIDDYLGKIDLIVLTSLSEAQPLVILECGAAGIPTVASNVGSCHEIIYGKEDENPQLGSGGSVTPLSNSKITALEIIRLLTDYDLYAKCSKTIKQRVKIYYSKLDQHTAYSEIYKELILKSQRAEEL